MFPKEVGGQSWVRKAKGLRVHGECPVSGTDFLELPQLLFFLMK